MMAKQKIREVFYSDAFEEFFASLDSRVREKYIWTIHAVETIRILPTKYVKKLENTDLYEMRVSVGTNEYRTVLFTMNRDNFITATEIYLLNSFLKKASKDYRRQIEIAEKMIKEFEL